MELISIIVPVYNAEIYLKKCIESVMNQTYPAWELVLVDDGSQDNSYSVCRRYSEKDCRIKTIHTDNYGRVHARSMGMQKSNGNLVTFLDSDDWVEPSALEVMYREMNEKAVDCVIAGYIETSEAGERVIYNQIPKGIYRDEKLQNKFYSTMLCHNDFFEAGIQPFLWNKLFKRKLIEPIINEIDEHIVVGEDVVCVYPALLQAKAILVMEAAFYHYCIHVNSTMRTYRQEEEEVENIKLQYSYMNRFFSQSVYSECLMKQLKRYILHHLMVRALSEAGRLMNGDLNFLFGSIPAGSSIVIYGAGAFGNAVYHYLQGSKEYAISAWCDRDFRKYQIMGYPVQSVGEALKCHYDYIFVAIMSYKTVEKIKKLLISDGVNENKIVWLDIQKLDQCDMGKLLN